MTVVDKEAGLYDEFGNYVGPEPTFEPLGVSGNEEDDNWSDVSREDMALQRLDDTLSHTHIASQTSSAVMLPEDRSAYPTSMQLYGPRVETLVEEVDTQPLSRPIIAPIKQKQIQLREPTQPKLTYQPEELHVAPENIRNVAVIGALHHGKTGVIDLLVNATHTFDLRKLNPKDVKRRRDEQLPLNFCDSLHSERLRKISLIGKPVTVKMADMVINFMDTPGHADFTDEAICQLRLCDGVIVVVDAVEGVLLQTERLVQLAHANDLPMVLVINKLDRLMLEVCIPPGDAFMKLQHIIASMDAIVGVAGLFSPSKGSVLFASSKYDWLFSLATFTRYRLGQANENDTFLRCLWSRHCTFQNGHLVKSADNAENPSAFVQLVLEPLYKLHSHVISSDVGALRKVASALQIRLKGSELALDCKPLLAVVMGKFLRWSAADTLAHAIKTKLPSPLDSAKRTSQLYLASHSDAISNAVEKCLPDGPLVAFVSKLYPHAINPHKTDFIALARVYSGTLTRGMAVRVLGPSFHVEDPQEDSAVARVKNVAFPGGGRYELETASAVGPGSIVLLYGVDRIIGPLGATIVDPKLPPTAATIMRPLRLYQQPMVKIAVEPLRIEHIPLMVETLTKLTRLYPSLKIRVEESGEHLVMGPGELYLDCAMRDLRTTLAHNADDETVGLEVRLTEPSSCFCETVADVSYSKATALTPNGKNHLVMLAEPIKNATLIAAIESGLFIYGDVDRAPFGRCETSPLGEEGVAGESVRMARIASALQGDFGFDALAARGFWSFGPHHLIGPNILIDDTLPGEVDAAALAEAKAAIIQGFRWATRAGPLCDEPMRGVQMRLIGASLSADLKERSSGQMVPAARKACFAAMLLANPRVMEPVLTVEILCPAPGIDIVAQLLTQRRGHLLSRQPIPACPLHCIRALIPVVDSFGFEVDVRIYTRGQSWMQSHFSHWQVVTGDPLDANVQLSVLEPSAATALARDFVVKTRRRKGLPEDPSVQRYFQP